MRFLENLLMHERLWARKWVSRSCWPCSTEFILFPLVVRLAVVPLIQMSTWPTGSCYIMLFSVEGTWNIRKVLGHLCWCVPVCVWACDLRAHRLVQCMRTSVHQVHNMRISSNRGKGQRIRCSAWSWAYTSCAGLECVCVCIHTCRQNTASEAAGQWTWRWQSSSWVGPWRSDGTCPRSSGRPNAERTTPSSGQPSLTADSEHTNKEKGREDNASH